MANPDVTDATLELIRGTSKLRELDLNDTPVTDAGLASLEDLPSLTMLHLSGKESLLSFDLRGTKVSSKTILE